MLQVATMDLMEKYLSRVKLEVGEKESKVNNNEVINILLVEEPAYTYEEVKKLEGVSVEGLAAIQKIKRFFPGASIQGISDLFCKGGDCNNL